MRRFPRRNRYEQDGLFPNAEFPDLDSQGNPTNLFSAARLANSKVGTIFLQVEEGSMHLQANALELSNRSW